MGANYQQYPFIQGELPPGWEEVPVGEIMLVARSGYSSGRHNQSGVGIPHLRPMNVSPYGEISMTDIRYVSPTAGSQRLEKKDILFTNTSSTLWVGKTGFVDNPNDWGFSNHMTRMRVAQGVSPEFAAYQLHYLCLTGYFSFHCKKHINQSSISRKQLTENVPFRLPPSREQARIVAKLRRLLDREQALRNDLKELPVLIQQYKAALLESACTGNLVGTEDEPTKTNSHSLESAAALLERILIERRERWEADQLTKIRSAGDEPKNEKWREKYLAPAQPNSGTRAQLPRGWVWASLEQLTDSTRVICYGILMPKSHIKDGVPYVKVRDIKGDSIDLPSLQRTSKTIANRYARSSLKSDDILLTIRGTYGRVAKVPKELEGANITQDTARLAFSPLVDRDFLMWQLRSPRMQRYFESAARGVAVKGVNIRDIRPAAIALPPLQEQRRIVKQLECSMAKIESLGEHIEIALRECDALRLSLVRQALLGNLVEQDNSEESAALLLAQIRTERKKGSHLPEAKIPPNKRMNKLSQEIVKETILKLPKNRFSFDDISIALEADYEPLKDLLFELLKESKPVIRQVFDVKDKRMKLEKVES